MMNATHPGRPDYTGPDEGWGGYVHHSTQVEYCWSFRERVGRIQREKPRHECAVRLVCLTYLGPAPSVLRQAAQAAQQTSQAYRQAWQAYEQAWQAAQQAAQAYEQTAQAYRQAWQAYRQAAQVYEQAWQAYRQAAQVYEQAWQAALTPEVLSALVVRLTALTPEAPWDGTQLVFGEPAGQTGAP